jgi:site-specific recombinase XerD
MLEKFLRRRAIIERLRAGLLGQHLDSFVAALSHLGYSRQTVQQRLRLLNALDQWLRRRSLILADLHESVINRFLAKRRASGRLLYGQAQAARDFLDHLRAQGVLRSPEPVIDEAPLAVLGRQYENYLKKERGLTPVTIAHHWHCARHFLVERFGDAPLCVRDLTPDDIARFLLRHARSGSPSAAKRMVTGLRSFFRFLFLNGQTESDLAGAVATVPQWRLAELPKYLTPEEVERVIQTCERDSPAAARDRAILLLLARLGLRAGEVLALELDDINWRAGELKVRGKGGQNDCLPLPADVGQAIAEYLRHHRPSCTTRRLFVLSQAPHRGFAHSTSLSTIVRRAIKRAGLHHAPFKGAHVLRHSLATGMLRSGASLDEIGQVLRHRAAPTTALYAKVDVQGLRSLALPWPTKETQP